MGQETWFTALPPILVLELSRFSYNQTSSMAEKLHSRLAFDRTLSLDRYLQKNRDEVRMRRKEVASLKHKLSNLRRRLNRFTCYQGRPVSIQQVLQMTLDFASQQSSVVREGADGRNEEVEQEEEEDGRRRMERQSQAGTGEKCPRMSVGPEPRYVSAEERALLEQCLGRWKAEVEEDMTELRDSVLSTEDTLGAVYSDSSMNTVIYHLHAVLVHQGQASGGHYWSYVRKPSCLSMETSVPAAAVMRAGPRSSGCGSETVEKSQPVTGPATAMATDSGAGGVGGGVGGGIGRNQENKPPGKAPGTEKGRRGGGGGGWLKFNDVSVHEVGWEEVVKESYGGHHNTSAYCLIYLSPLLHQSWSTTGIESEVPADLKECVDEDNETFKQEMADYDAKKEEEERLRENEVVPGSEIQVATGAGSGGVGPSLNNRTATNYLTGQKPDRSPEQMQVDSPPLPPVDMALRQELMQLVQSAYHRLGGSRMRRNSHRETGETPANENENIRLRLLDISSYIILSELAEDERVTPALNVFLLQVVERESAEGGGRGGGGGGGGREELRLLIKKEIVSALIKPGTQQMMNELRLLHNQLKLITHHFTIGVHALIQKKLESALVHSVHAYRLNCDLIRKAGERAGLRNLVIGILRRKALKEVSKGAMVLFDRGDVPAALQTATNLLVPTLKSMSELRCPGDDGVMESVREEWCNCLTHPSLSGSEQDQLADLLTRMFEEFSKSPDLTMPSTPAQPVLEPNQLSSDYENVMHRLGELVNS